MGTVGETANLLRIGQEIGKIQALSDNRKAEIKELKKKLEIFGREPIAECSDCGQKHLTRDFITNGGKMSTSCFTCQLLDKNEEDLRLATEEDI